MPGNSRDIITVAERPFPYSESELPFRRVASAGATLFQASLASQPNGTPRQLCNCGLASRQDDYSHIVLWYELPLL